MLGFIMANALPKHILRLLMLLCAALVAAYALKVYLTDPSYYEYGYYRADAVPELAEGEPRYLGSASCLECHEERITVWPVSAHKTVQCEVCHGTTEECPVKVGSRIPENTVRLCLTCHEKMPTRPDRQPQIVPGEHPFADGEDMPCIECHDPHAPGPVAREDITTTVEPSLAATAIAAPASAKKCAKCHGKSGEGVKQNPILAGVAAGVFIEKMNGYREGGGDNKVMIRFAKSLTDEEIAELAAYYESLGDGQNSILQQWEDDPGGDEQ
jgi:cytochrome c553